MTEQSHAGRSARASIDAIVGDVHRRARDSLPSPPEVAYKSKFLAWETRSSVRAKPRRVVTDLAEEERLGRVFFPPELVPTAKHPVVRGYGDAAVRRLLAQRVHCYLAFTSELEQLAVNPIAQRISRGRLGVPLPPRMLRDAYKICTDESWHAQVSDDLQYQIHAATGIAPRLPAEPRFMKRLQAVCAPLERRHADLVGVLFTIVSETLISSILADIPRDPRVLTPVRELVTDHAIDEGRHHSYFSQLLECIWPQLSASAKAVVAPLIPELVLGFLEPDYAAIACMLADCGLGAEETKQVIAECYDPRDVGCDVRQAAEKTIEHLRRCEVLEDPRTVVAFEDAGLIGFTSEAA